MLFRSISHLEGFTQRENVQYFEDFLLLEPEGETFVDVGAYDGYTSQDFIARCPRYRAVYAFEPNRTNFQKCMTALGAFPNVRCYPIGLFRSKTTLRFDSQASSSKVSDTGTDSIEVDRLDDVLNDTPTFIKMDTEGGESAAIEGGCKTIATTHPKMAISVYHRPGDFWRIPEQILAIRGD